MKKKPLLGFWQLWNMSFGYVGIQFGFSLQTANVSRIFETLGARIDDLAILWIAGPVAGLLVQPLIGHLSDKTWNRFGRRKPYFLLGAVLSSLSLLYMPLSPTLWVAAGMLWIMDASINIAMQPFRAFIGDMLPDEQRTTGFAVQTLFIGVSSVVAMSLPYIFTQCGIANTAPAGEIAASVRWSFWCGGLVMLVAVLYTIFKVREYSPAEQEDFNATGTGPAAVEGDGIRLRPGRYCGEGSLLLAVGLGFAALTYRQHWDRGLHILAFGLAAYGLAQLVTSWRYSRGRTSGLVEIIYDIKNMPRTMTQLALVTILTWFALFALFIYGGPAISSYHFHSTDPLSVAYNDGANWYGVLSAFYNGIAVPVALLLPYLARKLGRVGTHVGCLIIGGLGLVSMYFFREPKLLLVSMAAVGVAWASLLTLPYAILSSAVPHRKMGIYMGMFNMFVVIPQILASALLGLVLRTQFHNEPIYALVLGGVAMVLAGFTMLLVKDHAQ